MSRIQMQIYSLIVGKIFVTRKFGKLGFFRKLNCKGVEILEYNIELIYWNVNIKQVP